MLGCSVFWFDLLILDKLYLFICAYLNIIERKIVKLFILTWTSNKYELRFERNQTKRQNKYINIQMITKQMNITTSNKDQAMSSTTNIQLKIKSKQVPTLESSKQAKQSQVKNKTQSYVYRPPTTVYRKQRKQQRQNVTITTKESSLSSLGFSKIQVSKLSDVENGILSRRPDNMNTRPLQQNMNLSKQKQSQQNKLSQNMGNSNLKAKAKYLQRSQRQKLNSNKVSRQQYLRSPNVMKKQVDRDLERSKSKQVQIGLQINTDVKFFSIQTKQRNRSISSQQPNAPNKSLQNQINQPKRVQRRQKIVHQPQSFNNTQHQISSNKIKQISQPKTNQPNDGKNQLQKQKSTTLNLQINQKQSNQQRNKGYVYQPKATRSNNNQSNVINKDQTQKVENKPNQDILNKNTRIDSNKTSNKPKQTTTNQQITQISNQHNQRKGQGSYKKQNNLVQVKKIQQLQNGSSQSVMAVKIAQNKLLNNNQKQRIYIPGVAFSIFNLIIKKKYRNNLQACFLRILKFSTQSPKSQKKAYELYRKSSDLIKILEGFFKSEAFKALKINFISILCNLTPRHQNIAANRATGAKNQLIRVQSQQTIPHSSLTDIAKRDLCLQVNKLFKSRVLYFLRQKLFRTYCTQSYTINKQPIIQSLFKIFERKSKQNKRDFIVRIKFNFKVVAEQRDQDLLGFLQIKSTKLTMLDVTKYFEKIYVSPKLKGLGLNNQKSLLQKNCQYEMEQTQKVSQHKHPLSPGGSNSQAQKVTSLKLRIQNIQKQLNVEEMQLHDRQRQLGQKKSQVKSQLNKLKRDNQKRKKQNEQLKQKLKKRCQICLDSAENSRQQSKRNGKQLNLRNINGCQIQQLNQYQLETNQLMNSLNQIYISFFMMESPISQGHKQIVSVDDLFQKCPQANQLFFETLNHLILNDIGTSMIRETKQVVQERILLQKHYFIKNQIQKYQAQFLNNGNDKINGTVPKINQEVQTIKKLVNNYIKQRYLWYWIKTCLQKV